MRVPYRSLRAFTRLGRHHLGRGDLQSLSVPPIVTVRRMALEDLSAVDCWLEKPHVARWFLPETTSSAAVDKYRRRIEDPFSATTMCTVELTGHAIGWCQWYRWADYPESAESIGVHDGDIGADYAIGDPGVVGRGLGTAMLATLVDVVRLHYPRAGLVIVPEAENRASRRVLEKNDFILVDVRPLRTEPHDRPMAIYRLGPT